LGSFRFQQLLEVPMDSDDEDKYTAVSATDDDPLSNLILEVIKNDQLRKIERAKKQESEHSILMAAKLISPVMIHYAVTKRGISGFTSLPRPM
jgi:hypothetical protein